MSEEGKDFKSLSPEEQHKVMLARGKEIVEKYIEDTEMAVAEQKARREGLFAGARAKYHWHAIKRMEADVRALCRYTRYQVRDLDKEILALSKKRWEGGQEGAFKFFEAVLDLLKTKDYVEIEDIQWFGEHLEQAKQEKVGPVQNDEETWET